MLADSGAVRHELSFPRAHNQYVHVESVFPAGSGPFELVMPVWTPGSYLVREFSAHVERLDATGPDGTPLAVRKTAKNRWRVDPDGAGEVRVAYDVWAGELHVGTSWVESSFALLNGAGLFLFTRDSRSLPQLLTVSLPQGWTAAHSSMDRPGPAWRFRAADYDELVDSPLVAGSTVQHDFEVAGHPYGLVFSGENPMWDGERAAADAARLIGAHQAFWGINPFTQKYLVMTLFMGSFAGLEHDHSTVLMIDALSTRNSREYQRWLGLVSHEFFHAWNVRRMRPQALSEYDYEKETYIRELWLAEGLTSYYDELLLFRSGLIDVGDYLRLLAKEIRNYETTPGREIRSAELASFDTWIKHYRQDENSVNSTVSYYRKGAVIGFVLDTAIRRETRGDASLDDVMRAMFQRYGRPESGGYPPGAFEDIVEEIAGSEVRLLTGRLVRETIDPDVDSALAWYGLALDRNPAANGNGPPPGGFGIEVDAQGPALVVTQVVAGHSASDAGVLPGDELIAVDGFRVTAANYDLVLDRFRPGESTELTLSRHGRLMSVPAAVQPAIPAEFLITVEDRLSSRQKSRLEQWLGRDLVFR